jgi:hypothetical protein
LQTAADLFFNTFIACGCEGGPDEHLPFHLNDSRQEERMSFPDDGAWSALQESKEGTGTVDDRSKGKNGRVGLFKTGLHEPAANQL